MRPRLHLLPRLIFFVAGCLVLFALVSFTVGLGATAYSIASGTRGTPVQIPPSTLQLLNLLFYPPILLWMWFCRHIFDKRNYVSLGVGLTRLGRLFLAGALAGILMSGVVSAALWLTGQVSWRGFSPDAIGHSSDYIASQMLLYAAFFLAVGYFEEIFNRGYLMQNLIAQWGYGVGMVAQSAFFALLHLMNPGYDSPMIRALAMLNIALFGWLAAQTYFKSGSLWFAIGMHAAWNFFLGCVYSMPVSGNETFRLFDVAVAGDPLVTGGGFGPEAGLFTTIVLGACILLARLAPDHSRALHEIAALRRGEPLHSLPPLSVAPSLPLEAEAPADAAPAEYSAPRYKTSLRRSQSRPAPIDWSDINMAGQPAPEAPTAFAPAANAPTAAAVSTQPTSVAVPVNAAPTLEEATPSLAPQTFTPNLPAPLNAAPGQSSGIFAPETTPVTPENAPATPIKTLPAAPPAPMGEAPIPAGARLAAARSNFGDTPSDPPTDSALTSTKTTSADAPIAQDAPTPRNLEAPPPLPTLSTQETLPSALQPPPLPDSPPLFQPETAPADNAEYSANAAISSANTPRDPSSPAPRDFSIDAPPPMFSEASTQSQKIVPEASASGATASAEAEIASGEAVSQTMPAPPPMPNFAEEKSAAESSAPANLPTPPPLDLPESSAATGETSKPKITRW